jgi:hypothetical protein
MVAAGCAGPEPVVEEPVVEEPVVEEPVVEEMMPMLEVPAPSVTRYVNAEYGFSINFPEGWIESKSGFPNEVTSFAPGPQPILPIVAVYLEYVVEGTTVAEFGPQQSQSLVLMMPEFILVSEGEVTLDDGTPAYELVYQFFVPDFNVQLQEKALYVIRGTEAFNISGVTMPTSFAANEPNLDASLYSFRLEEPVAEEPVAEEPVAEEPVVEEPVVEEPVVEEPVVEEPVVEEPEPSAGPIYTNAEHGFSISYPEGWTKMKTGQTEGEVMSFVHPAQIPVVAVSLGSVAEGTTLAAYGAQQIEELSTEVTNFELVSQGEVTLDDGTPAYEIVYKSLFVTFNLPLESKTLYVIRGTEVFGITGVDMAASFAKNEATLTASIYSFHFD